VHLLGPLHGDAKWEAFRDATCFALTSRQEGFSIAITEALACGLPVVISRECHFPEVAEFGAGEVVSLDPTEIAGAFDKLVNNRMVRESMAGAARDLISRRFDLLTIAGNLVQEYKQRADPNVPQAGQVGTGGG
jgi:glycosyltransferase involved in cell wall biosynthesis